MERFIGGYAPEPPIKEVLPYLILRYIIMGKFRKRTQRKIKGGYAAPPKSGRKKLRRRKTKRRGGRNRKSIAKSRRKRRKKGGMFSKASRFPVPNFQKKKKIFTISRLEETTEITQQQKKWKVLTIATGVVWMAACVTAFTPAAPLFPPMALAYCAIGAFGGLAASLPRLIESDIIMNDMRHTIRQYAADAGIEEKKKQDLFVDQILELYQHLQNELEKNLNINELIDELDDTKMDQISSNIKDVLEKLLKSNKLKELFKQGAKKGLHINKLKGQITEFISNDTSGIKEKINLVIRGLEPTDPVIANVISGKMDDEFISNFEKLISNEEFISKPAEKDDTASAIEIADIEIAITNLNTNIREETINRFDLKPDSTERRDSDDRISALEQKRNALLEMKRKILEKSN